MANPTAGAHVGAYQIERVIGAGSMGDVFGAVDTGLGRKVAIKILAEKHRDSQELRARFVREGRAVAAISHANVVSVFATGAFDDRPFIAMELLDGLDLGSMVEQQGALGSLVAARAIRDAALGLAAAADAGLIHRDVKPSNLVLLKNGIVKVTDFGLAKPVDPGSEPALTAMGVVVGTPDYIAPEQARGEAIDKRVDIYALGGTLYFLLTSIPPFRTGKPAEDKYLKVVARHLKQPPPDAHATRPEVDRELAELARQMMAKAPADRPGYPALIEKLSAVIGRLDGSAVNRPAVAAPRPRAFEPETSDSAATFADDLGASLQPPRRVPTWLKGLTLVAAIVFTAGLTYYLTRTASRPAKPAAPVAPAPTPLPPLPPPVPTPPTQAVPPAGMVKVDAKAQAPALFVATSPVTHAEFARLFAKHKIPKGAADKPVTGIGFTQARAFAQSKGRRLLRADEYDRAIAAAGVAALPPKLWEWVDTGVDPQQTVRAGSNTGKRTDGAPKDVTFRVAADLP